MRNYIINTYFHIFDSINYHTTFNIRNFMDYSNVKKKKNFNYPEIKETNY